MNASYDHGYDDFAADYDLLRAQMPSDLYADTRYEDMTEYDGEDVRAADDDIAAAMAAAADCLRLRDYQRRALAMVRDAITEHPGTANIQEDKTESRSSKVNSTTIYSVPQRSRSRWFSIQDALVAVLRSEEVAPAWRELRSTDPMNVATDQAYTLRIYSGGDELILPFVMRPPFA
ncbi:MAG: hypothetical protein ACR2M4_02885 [Actinomycetota bacterium]